MLEHIARFEAGSVVTMSVRLPSRRDARRWRTPWMFSHAALQRKDVLSVHALFRRDKFDFVQVGMLHLDTCPRTT